MLSTEGILKLYISCFRFWMIVKVNKNLLCFTGTVLFLNFITTRWVTFRQWSGALASNFIFWLCRWIHFTSWIQPSKAYCWPFCLLLSIYFFVFYQSAVSDCGGSRFTYGLSVKTVAFMLTISTFRSPWDLSSFLSEALPVCCATVLLVSICKWDSKSW